MALQSKVQYMSAISFQACELVAVLYLVSRSLFFSSDVVNSRSGIQTLSEALATRLAPLLLVFRFKYLNERKLKATSSVRG